eukprot:Pgem_evm1s11208
MKSPFLFYNVVNGLPPENPKHKTITKRNIINPFNILVKKIDEERNESDREAYQKYLDKYVNVTRPMCNYMSRSGKNECKITLCCDVAE